MPTPMTSKTVNYSPNCEPEAIQQVMEILERWRQRSEDHFTNYRKDHRFPYSNRALVICQEKLGGEVDVGSTAVALEVHTRNLSCGGVSLLAPPVFVAKHASEDAPPLRSERLLAVGREVSVGLALAPDEFLWMRGTVIRSRPVHFGFRECGISFVSRLDASQSGSSDETPPPPDPIDGAGEEVSASA